MYSNYSFAVHVIPLGARKVSQLTKQMQQWQDDLDIRLKGKKIPPKYWEFPELEKGNLHEHCGHCFDINCPRKLNLGDTGDDTSCCTIKCKSGCGAKYHACKAPEHNIICPKFEEPDEYDWMYRGVLGDHHHGATFAKNRRKKKKLDKSPKPESAKSIGDFLFGPGQLACKPTYQKINGKRVITPPVAPATKAFSLAVIRVDLRLETETRLQTKPKSMYTFVCAQQFRRDEYHWHCKNVHDEILGGMNNWLEQRCPMSSYGCGYSHRRMHPKLHSDGANTNKISKPKSTIVFSPAVESFGISAVNKTPTKTKTQKLSANSKKPLATKKLSKPTLTDLPYEILYEILDLLDSFR